MNMKSPLIQLAMAHSCVYSSLCTNVKLDHHDPVLALHLTKMVRKVGPRLMRGGCSANTQRGRKPS